MTTKTIRNDANKTIAYYKSLDGAGIPESGMSPLLKSQRMLEIAEIAEKMTEDEWERIHSVPDYTNDMTACRDIKEKYGLSWNEIRTLRIVER